MPHPPPGPQLSRAGHSALAARASLNGAGASPMLTLVRSDAAVPHWRLHTQSLVTARFESLVTARPLVTGPGPGPVGNVQVGVQVEKESGLGRRAGPGPKAGPEARPGTANRDGREREEVGEREGPGQRDEGLREDVMDGLRKWSLRH
jgi:hypothetical protein